MTKSRLVYVALEAPYADHNYGFRTTAKQTTSTALGHQVLSATTPVAGLIFKANHPKPKRATKTFLTGTESSFIAPSVVISAIAAGWDIIKAKSNGRKQTGRFSKALYVTVNNVKYAWAVPKKTWLKLQPNAVALGIREVLGTEQDLVFGASFPKPPRVKANTFQGDMSLSTSTFYDNTNDGSLPSEFIRYKGQFTSADWSNFV
jgi:hypothetical protein